ncbi:hypothetical protein [Hymenobacter sp. BT190]|uniref:hypothetical protein n=1 Tax=Hymenobacter sp. BT190 TaxID=2763505 RepID=UPI00165147E0|nr:hypothetical protein [Hymenobacter sp. BT190]MBC6698955.1 hypothetical protein [Hymenobacter sp. BT190]
MRTIMSCVLLLGLTACNSTPQEKQQVVKHFKPITYSLAKLSENNNHLLDSLRALHKADTSLIKWLSPTSNTMPGEDAFYQATRFYRYNDFTIGESKAVIVAVITDFNTLSASLQLLMFDKAGKWLSTMPLALYYDEAGATDAMTSIQTTLDTFVQQRVVEDFKYGPETPEVPTEILGRLSTTTHTLVKLDKNGVHKTQLDSTTILKKQ